MIPYLLYAALLLAICWAFYKLLLQTETFYHLNRYILLACLGICFTLPLINIPLKWSVHSVIPPDNTVTTQQVSLPQQTVTLLTPPNTTENTEQPITKTGSEKHPITQKPVKASPSFTISTTAIMKWLIIVYWAGVIVFAFNLLIQIASTLYQAFTMPVIADGSYRIIELNGNKMPCSFFNYIFINPTLYDWETYSQILQHEKVHVKQRHSVDILLAELCIIFQWFNPFAWLYRREVENNIEYLTDEIVVNHATDRSAYQLSLLKVSASQFSLRIATNYNQSLLKKRITMMNAKKSNLHTLWKYFTLLPLFGLMMFALNEPAKSKEAKPDKPISKNTETGGSITALSSDTAVVGYWFATRDGNKLNMDFRTSTKNHNWNYNNSSILVTELSAYPTKQKENFTLTREAGTVLLNGKFDGDEGLGRFKLKPNKKYAEYLEKEGLGKIEVHDLLQLLLVDVKESYLKHLYDYGFKTISVNDLGNLRYFGVDENDMRFWSSLGLKDMLAKDLWVAKVQKIDSSYVREIYAAGYKNVGFIDLMRCKSYQITGDYIRSIVRAAEAIKKPGDTTSTLPPINDLLSAKHMDIDSTYLRQMSNAGYHLTSSQLYSFKSNKVTPGYLKQMQDLGYSNIPYATVIDLVYTKIDADFIKEYQAIGFNDIPVNYLPIFKRQNITPDFIKSFLAMGFKNIKAADLVQVKAQNLSPEYIKSFAPLGYKDLELTTLIRMKTEAITPEFIKGFNDIGFSNIPMSEILQLKNADVTPQYVSSMQQKGLNAKDIHKYISLKNSFN